jgi:hypothetical protein
MNKDDFKRALREKLQKVPVETRKQWDDTNLFGWWAKMKAEDSYLTWDHCTGDVWQWVKIMCHDLIDQNANIS